MDSPKIIFEDDSFMVLDKPSGWITNEAQTTTNQPVVQTWVRENFHFPIFANAEYRNGIVHRLDKETSGILLVAKTEKAFERLQRQFKERIVQKKYIALAHGKVSPASGEIAAPVGRLPWRKDRFGVLPGGREAVTLYRITDYYEKAREPFSLMELSPRTGRTHQIRIHLKYINHPIVGDSFYAGRKTAREDRKWCPRLFLHASEISFVHPDTKENVAFSANLASDLQNALKHLEKIDISERE